MPSRGCRRPSQGIDDRGTSFRGSELHTFLQADEVIPWI
jgi:hypothetical protein